MRSGSAVPPGSAGPPPRVLHLLRHGQSTWNLEGRVQGATAHVPLTALGRCQAQAAAAALARHGVSRVVSSDLVRAATTAAEVAAACGVALETDPSLREQHLGRYEGRLPGELEPEPEPVGVPLAAVRWGGGESLHDVAARLAPSLEPLRPAAAGAGQVVLVTHGDTLRVARALLLGHGPDDVVFDAVPNGSVTTVREVGGVLAARTWQPALPEPAASRRRRLSRR